ncbi:39S ribosomal protein L13, mitochondrial-like isoform X2 [Pomacea canaliculata]|uniref:39S ribosomal protein L13, mitochondrial-like isoform X2 n=1 Tax=Pomacea canaliculata TaxID=400727 RepID=UPI000D739FF9|nr:39S ribosomal protein L13, mitochondrial-like isoform X2 [Pomacea canaliculata]XP_025109265.1 39S ribosomal protein L13, mitochondrial-like isoform X2 [Pomacea canaliculata]XP_025109266.1 39S ribosomal protein L13, mitochondrial-like isoform X2 [Pomacea canaliculata]
MTSMCFFYSGYICDVGDHVVVINTKDIAMPGTYWRTFKYFHHTAFPGGFSQASAWRVHEIDPTLIMYKSVYTRMPGTLQRRYQIQRLHLYPDDKIPDEIQENLSDQIIQVQEVPKRLDEYSEKEITEFPKLFDWPADYVKDEYKRHITRKKPKNFKLK